MNGTRSRTAVAAILAGVLYFAGQAGELLLDRIAAGGEAVFVVLGVAGIVALGVAFWGLRAIVSHTADPIHDIGLFVFEAAWVGLGVALLRARPGQQLAATPAHTAAT